MLKIIYTGKDTAKIEKAVLKAFDFAYKFFNLKLTNIIVCVSETRAEYNRILKRKTLDWEVGSASRDGRIDILGPLAMQNESCHSRAEFPQILKHEFTHLFIDKLAKGKTVPKWLDEGLAQYIAGQHKCNHNLSYLEEDFCQELGSLRGWDKNINHGAYSIAALFVAFLIKKYSFSKIKELIISLDKIYYYSRFKKIFFAIYKKELSEVERLFAVEVNSK